jgi:hypothetical protein
MAERCKRCGGQGRVRDRSHPLDDDQGPYVWLTCPDCNGKPPEAYELEEYLDRARTEAEAARAMLHTPVSQDSPLERLASLPLPPANVLWDCMELAVVIATSWVNPPWINQWKAQHQSTVDWLDKHGAPYLPDHDPETAV